MKNPFDLKGQVAVITGSSKGIGRSIAETWRPWRQGGGLEPQGGCLRGGSGCHQARAAAKPSSFPATSAASRGRGSDQRHAGASRAASTRSSATRPSILISGRLPASPTMPSTRSWLRTSRAICGSRNLTAPGMAEQGGGSIIIVSSIGGMRGSAMLGAYGISKAADFALARSLAVEWGPKNVRVNCHRAGPGEDRFRPRTVGEPGQPRQAPSKTTPLRRIGEPDEIGGIVAFLASQAAAYMTGHGHCRRWRRDHRLIPVDKSKWRLHSGRQQ